MAGKISNGISEIQVDSVVLGFTEEDSFSIITEDNTSTQSFNVEEQADPIFKIVTGSKVISFEFTVADPNEATIIKLFDGTGTPDVVLPGISNILKSVAFEVTAIQGWGFSVADADVSSRFTDSMGKNSLLGVVINVTPNAGFTLKDTPETT